MEFYQAGDIQQILMHSARRLGIKLAESGALEMAKRSRGTPRIANRLLRRVRDFAEVHGSGVIDEPLAQAALASLDVDHRGLDTMDKKILRTIIEKFDGGPVGIDSLAAAIGEESQTLEDVYEPFLLQQGFIQRTPRGRLASRLSYEHFGLAYRAHPQAELEF
jgi:Holliday junction DNA helicase RuvB